MTVTDKQKANLQPFTNNPADPQNKRRHTKGRITKKDQFVKMLTDLFNEPVLYDEGNIKFFDGEQLTRLKARARVAMSSRNYKEFELLLAYVFGKPKEQIDLSNNDGSLQSSYTPEQIAQRVAALMELAEKRKNESRS